MERLCPARMVTGHVTDEGGVPILGPLIDIGALASLVAGTLPSETRVMLSAGAKRHWRRKPGKYELYKTTHNFDGTYQNPQWLG